MAATRIKFKRVLRFRTDSDSYETHVATPGQGFAKKHLEQDQPVDTGAVGIWQVLVADKNGRSLTVFLDGGNPPLASRTGHMSVIISYQVTQA